MLNPLVKRYSKDYPVINPYILRSTYTSYVLKKKNLNILLLFATSFLFWQCASSEKSGMLGQVYHNTTAQYNAYFLGSERLTAAEAKITKASLDDYNHILPLFPNTDTAFTSQFRPEFEEVIKKASFAIKKHPKSKWTSDSYILVGKARYFMGDFDEAIRTFRFANTSSKKDQVRYRAQVWLMRCFIAQGDFESAAAVSDLLKKVKLNKNNAIHLFLNRAEYHLQQKDTTLAINNLKLAIPIMKNKDYQARARFILAQLYQATNQNKQAFDVYTRIVKHNPPYELGFYSKLNLGQVTELSNPDDKARVDKYFTKLLKDPKNLDFKDKIYYEMARFALKQQQYEPALAYLQQSTKAPSTNETQKAYSHLLAGKIYYENLQKYNLAYAYYDSAVQAMDPISVDYQAASERRDVLKEFSTHYTTVQTQDSLQALARLDSASLNKRIVTILEQRAQQRLRQEQQLANDASNQSNLSNLSFGLNNGNNRRGNNANSGGTWYFDNPASVARARAEFVQKWGNRQLQDNWRLSSLASSVATQSPTNTANTPDKGPDNTAPDSIANNPAIARQELLRDIPNSPERLQESNNLVEEALFNLANIYQQQLNEPVRAAETFEKLLQRFPATKHKSEAYYSLYLIYQEQKSDKAKTYADLVKKELPGSKYARLIDQPDYLKQVLANNNKARQLYDSAFVNYHRQRYPVAITLANQVQQQYPDSELADRVAYLKVLLAGRTQKPEVFKTAVRQFIEQYPNSTLIPNAEEILNSFEAYESGKLSLAEFNKTRVQRKTAPDVPEVTEEEPIAEEPVEETVTEEPVAPEPAEAELPRPNRRRPQPRQNKNNPAAPVEEAPSDVTDTNSEQADPVAAEQDTVTQAVDPVENTTPGAGNNAAPATEATPTPTTPAPVTPAPAEPKASYTANLTTPHLVVVAYPKNNPAFKDILTKMNAYNAKYNLADKLTVDSTSFNGTTNFLIIKEFDAGKKAASYATKQKAPQSPLSKIRGIEFATFAISSENLLILMKEGKLEDYLAFYKNTYF
ncbi:tetratricopeptide repeat protein [Adhaeribacter swui]|uniref:Tetratricopeptide repeat protein n=1 Tax=Adhaeribacter swui TaxID=2086471 RepID=A0A7G7G5I4_9BACT|nr:tetratricopeptide repeat protein [Adhaeribacter swui]QNF32418.1 tetratricopeptide repeat protein [Adhaeribacter swui]